MRRMPVRLAAVLLSVPLALGSLTGPGQAATGAPAAPAAPGRDPFVPLITTPGGETAPGSAAGPDRASAPGAERPLGSGSDGPVTELPRTGPRTGPLTGLAVLLVVLGAALARAGGRRSVVQPASGGER